MANYLKYGDQIFIEITTTSIDNEEQESKSSLLGSNAFLDENLYAVSAKSINKCSFLNCIFTTVPCLLDAQDDIDLTAQLESDLNDALTHDADPNDEARKKQISELRTKIEEKKAIIKEKEESLKILNDKIMAEAQSRPIKFGEVFMLRHLISGSFLKGQQNSHPLDRGLLNLSLTNVRNSDCYFKILPNITGSQNEPINYDEELKIISYKYKTFMSIGSSPKESGYTKNLDKNDDENEDEEFRKFPRQIKRNFGLETFEHDKYPVGLKYENSKVCGIKLHPYLRSEENEHIRKNKSLKNGDFIRIHLNNFYLTINIGELLKYELKKGNSKKEYGNLLVDNDNTIFNTEDKTELTEAKAGLATEKKLDDDYIIEESKPEDREEDEKAKDIQGEDNVEKENKKVENEVKENQKEEENDGEGIIKKKKQGEGGIKTTIATFNFQDVDNYDYNSLNSIFQIVEIANDGIPTADEIHANPKKLEESMDPINFYLKHYSTGRYFGIDSDFNFVLVSNEEIEKEENTELPFAQFIASTKIASGEFVPISRNSSFSFKVFYQKDSEGRYLDMGDHLQRTIIVQEVNKEYYFGREHPEDYIEDHIKLTKREPKNQVNTGALFNITAVSNQEMKNIYEMDSYSSFLRVYLRNINAVKNKNKKVKIGDFNKLTEITTQASYNFIRSIMKLDIELSNSEIADLVLSEINSDFGKQMLVRESGLLDLINKIIYYLLIEASTLGDNKATQEERVSVNAAEDAVDISALIGLLTTMAKIVMICIKDNPINQRYNAQYIRVYIIALIAPSGFFSGAKQGDIQNIQEILLELLTSELSEEEETALDQLRSYTSMIFYNILQTPNIQPIYIKLMTYICQVKAPNFDNTIRTKFLEFLLTNDQLTNLLPKITFSKDNSEVMCTVKRATHNDVQFSLTEYSDNINNFKIIMELINTLCQRKSFAFMAQVIQLFPINLCSKVIDHPKVVFTCKEQLANLLKSAHHTYGKLPFGSPNFIQFLFHNSTEYEAKMNNIYAESKKKHILVEEREIIKKLGLMALLSDSDDAPRTEIQGEALDLNSFKKYLRSRNTVESEEERLKIETDMEYLSHRVDTMVLKLQDNIMNISGDDFCLTNLKELHFAVWGLLQEIAEYDPEKNNGVPLVDTYIGKIFYENYYDIFNMIRWIDIFLVNKSSYDLISQAKNCIHNDGTKKISISALEEVKEEAKEANDPHHKHTTLALGSIKNRLLKMFVDKGDDGAINETKILIKLIEKGSMKIVAEVIHALEKRVKFEENIYKETSKWCILDSEQDADIFNNVLESMLKCNEMARKINIFHDFKMEFTSNTVKEILKDFKKNFEILIESLYDIQGHMEAKSHSGSSEVFTKKREYFELIYNCKAQTPEIPFVLNPSCLRTKFQRLMIPLKIHEILIPLIKSFYNLKDLDPDFIVLARYILIIMILFVYKNEENQEELCKYDEFINMYYSHEPNSKTSPFLDFSVESVLLGIEMFRDNTKLLAFERKYFMDIVYWVFIWELKDLDFINKPEQRNDPRLIAAMKSLIIAFQSKLPKDLFDPVDEFVRILIHFSNFMKDENIINFENMMAESKGSKSIIKIPVFYYILDEFLFSFNDFVKNADRDDLLRLQKQLSIKTFWVLLKNPNIEFNSNIKWKIISIINGLYYSTLRKPNLFENDEDFEQFLSIILIDLTSYIHWRLDLKGECTIFASPKCFVFNIDEVKERLVRVNDRVKKTGKDQVFQVYQFYKKKKKIWNRYIYVLFSFLADLFDYERERIVEIRDKENDEFQDFFDIFIATFSKFSDIVKSEKSYKFIEAYNEFLKRIHVISEYTADINCKEVLSNLKITSDNLLESLIKEENGQDQKNEQKTLEVGDVILKSVEKAKINGDKTREQNIKDIAKNVVFNGEFNEGCISQLIKFLDQDRKNVLRKDIIFVLKLLRKMVEIQISTPSEEQIYEWDDISASDLEKIEIAQNKLNDHNIVNAIFQLMYNNKDETKIIKEAFLISLAIVFGGNKAVQDAFYQEFRSDSENEIVQLLSKILESSFEQLLEHESAKNNSLYFKAQTFLLTYNNKMDDNNPPNKEKMAEDFYNELKSAKESKSHKNSKKESRNALVTILLKFLQSLCENHNNDFQNFLRDQLTIEGDKVHPKSFDFIRYLRHIFEGYYHVINISNIDIGIKLVDLLIEVIQGDATQNTELMLKKSLLTDLCSVLVIFDGELDLLPRGFGFDKYHEKFHNLKSKALNLLKNLIERSDERLLTEMTKCVNLDSLMAFLSNCFIKYVNEKGSLPNKKNIEISEYTENQYLMDGFTAYIIFKYLWQNKTEEETDNEFKRVLEKIRLTKEEKETMSYMLFNFCKKYVGSIEILLKKTNHLMKIYFPIYVLYDYLGADVKENFEENVDRSNSQAKLEELMSAVPEFINMATLEYDARNRFLGLNMFIIYSVLRFVTDTLAIGANLINLFTLHFIEGGAGGEDVGALEGGLEQISGGIEGGEGQGIENAIATITEAAEDAEGYIWQDAGPQYIVSVLCFINCIISLCLMGIWVSTKAKSYIKTRWEEYAEENAKESNEARNLENEIQELSENHAMSRDLALKILKYGEPYSEEWNQARSIQQAFFYYKAIHYLVNNGSFMWHAFFLVICATSAFHPVICGFQLLDIVVRSDTVSRIAKAVSQNARQFLWTLVLLLTTVYIYSLMAFYYLQDVFIDEDGETRLCVDEYSCFLVNINYGLRSGGGIADVIQKASYDADSRWAYFTRVIYDLSFFIAIIILLLNLIFGMIIDSFGDLRDEKNSNDDDRKNTCFICGMTRSDIERYFDFEKHIDAEHNKWLYLAYILYIEQKHENLPTELTDFESYVWERYSKQDFEWIPTGRSLTLEKIFEHDEKSKKSDIEVMKEELGEIIKVGNDEGKLLIEELKEIKSSLAKFTVNRRSVGFRI